MNILLRLTFLFTIVFAVASCEKMVTNENSEIDKQAFINRLNNLQYGSYGIRTQEYKYDYTVSGTDEKGNEVSGDINLDGKQGEGKIYSTLEEKNIDIVIDSAEKSKAIATDADGNKYFLDVK